MIDDEKKKIIDDEATRYFEGEATLILGDTSQVLGDKTELLDDTMQVMKKSAKKTLEEICQNDIVHGYTVGALISESGGEAVIRLAQKGNKQYVIKIFRQGHSIDYETEKIIMDIKSKYVMPILARGEYKGIHYEILPYYKNNTFKEKFGQLSQDGLMSFIHDVNEGLHAIHVKNVFHNDIKPENIFVADDGKTAIIGDFGISKFGAERTHVTNIGNMSQYYAAPEAREISTEKTDYFSLGRTIADIAFGKNIFEGLVGKTARLEILNDKLALPKEIPENVRDLIVMLTEYKPGDRIGYNGVKRWLSDPTCYAGCSYRAEQDENSLIINYRFGKDRGKKDYRDTYSLAVAMNDEQELAMHQLEDIEYAIKMAPQQDPQLKDEIFEIRKAYESDLPFGLFLTLHTLNPKLTIKFAGKKLYNFGDYINMLISDYGNDIDEHFARKEFVNVLLNHSNNIPENLVDLIQCVVETYRSPIDIFDIYLNLFGDSKKFYYNGTVYDTFGDFLNEEVFLNNGKPNVMKWERIREEFLSVYLKRLSIDENSVKSIIDEKDKTTEYFKLGKLINGHIPLKLCGKHIKNLYDIIQLIANKKETQSVTDLSTINDFLSNDGFSKIMQFENKKEENLNNIVKGAENKVSYIYYYCYQNAKFMECVTVNDLIKLMGKESSNSIESKSREVLESEDFKIWMETRLHGTNETKTKIKKTKEV